MKLFIKFTLLTTLGLSSSAFASLDACYEVMTEGYTKDARSFHLDRDDFDRELGDQGESLAIAKLVAKKAGCENADEVIAYANDTENRSSCAQLIPGNSMSLVCYVETNMGYFVISETLPYGLAVTWSRWD